MGAGKTVLLDHCSPRILGDFVPLITSQLRYVSILKCILPVDCKAMHPYTPSLCLSLPPSLSPSFTSSLPLFFLLSLFHCLSLLLFLFFFTQSFSLLLPFFSPSLQHPSAHWSVRYEAASTSYCGQMGIERERTLQMKLSKFALMVRGGEEGEKCIHLCPVLLFCSEVSYPGSQSQILRDNHTVRHATPITFVCLFVCLFVYLFVCLLSTHCINTLI